MYHFGAKDGDLVPDWGRTSADYAAYRAGYPESFYARLAEAAIPTPGMRVLDLGTGTGVLARGLARRGARVLATDISAEQLEAGRRLAAADGLAIDFEVSPAERTGRPDGSFDLVSASQCWLYFDHARAVPEIRRLLAPGGRLLICFIGWLPLADRIAGWTEKLVLRHNPAWSAAGFTGEVPPEPTGTRGVFTVARRISYDERVSFTRESWRGRMRACRGVGATLPPERVTAFDRELEALLGDIAGPEFDVLHRIEAVILERAEERAGGGPAPAGLR